MKILILYANNEGYFRCPIGLTLIMTILRDEGHEVKLFDTTFTASTDNKDNRMREKLETVKSVPTAHLFKKQSNEKLISAWIKTIKDFKPDLIAASIIEDLYKFCGTFLDAAKENFDIPIAVGGVTPSLSPNIVIEHPSIDMIIQGEGEIAFKELVIALKNKTSLSEVPNLWYKENGKVIRNKLTRFMDLNKLPYQRLDFWDKRHFNKPYNGTMYKLGSFELSRGCMHKCHYCFNRYMQTDLPAPEVGKYRRNKSIEIIIREVKELHKEHNFGLIMFTDDNFLGRSFSDMDEFYERWNKEINIPYWINTCIETLNEQNLPKLKKSQCIGISIGMETGSEWIRRNLLLKGKMTNDMYYEGFKMMTKHGIRSTCNVMIGFPGEYEEDVFDTIKLNKKIRALDPELTSCKMSYVAPYAGTVIHNISMDLGLIEVDDKPGYKGLTKNISTFKEPLIKNPHMSKERITELFHDFSDYINGKKDIPEKFLNIDPLRKFAKNDSTHKIYELYKEGPRDIEPEKINTLKYELKKIKKLTSQRQTFATKAV